MKSKYVLAIDQGTTSSRAILFNQNGDAVYQAQRELECFYPHRGWVEQDALQIWLSVIDVINEVFVKSNLSMKDVECIGITNQRETTIVWDKNTGMPVYNAIVWQSRQSADICDKLEDKKDFIHKKTGLLINPYFSASKLRFILDAIPNGQKRAEDGELLFGTVDSWLIYKMSKGTVHMSDPSNASRTLLYNIFTNDWDDELLELFNIPRSMLPKVSPSSSYFADASFFPHGAKITGVAGDQQAALFGQTCFKKGDSKNTYGTGCFMLLNVGDKPILSNNGLLTTIAWQINDQVTYALEGSVFIGGAIIQWLRDEMNIISKASDSDVYAYKCNGTSGVYVVPAFVGLGTPYWDDDARGAIFGLTRGTNKYQIVRACLEGIAFQCKDVYEVMKLDTGLNLRTLKVDGGATKSRYLLQFQSDILDTVIKVPQCLETTALGVSYLAGLYTGYFKSLEHIEKTHSYQGVYEPEMSKEDRIRKTTGWKKAVKATREFE